MRVLMLTDLSSYHSIRWFKMLERQGIDIWAFSFEKPLIEHEKFLYFKKGMIPQRLRYTLGVIDLKKVIRKIKPDLLHPHQIACYGWLCFLANEGLPVFLVSWGEGIFRTPKKSPFHKLLTKLIIKNSDFLFVDAYFMKEIVMKEFGYPSSKIMVDVMGPDEEVYNHEIKEFKSIDTFKFVTYRRLEPSLHPLLPLKAFKKFVEIYPNSKLFILSGGSMEGKVREFIYKNGLFDRVEYLGRVSNEKLWEILSDCHFYISPSPIDSTSVSLLEAFSFGLIPIVTNIPGNREWVIDGINGFLFEPGKYSDLLRKMIEAVNMDLDKINQIRKLNKEIVLKKANLNKVISKVIKVMENLVFNRKRWKKR